MEVQRRLGISKIKINLILRSTYDIQRVYRINTVLAWYQTVISISLAWYWNDINTATANDACPKAHMSA